MSHEIPRRRADDQGWAGALNGLPWWVKAIAIVGFPVATAAFFMLQDAGVIPSINNKTNQAVAAQHELMVSHDEKLEALSNSIKLGLRIMCENNATTQAQRNNCQNIR